MGKRVKLSSPGSRRQSVASAVRSGGASSKCFLGGDYVPGPCCYWTGRVQAGLEHYSWNWLVSGGTEDREAEALGRCLKETPLISGLPKWSGVCQDQRAVRETGTGDTGPGQPIAPPLPSVKPGPSHSSTGPEAGGTLQPTQLR